MYITLTTTLPECICQSRLKHFTVESCVFSEPELKCRVFYQNPRALCTWAAVLN